MSELFMMTTITSRNMVTKFLSFYKESQMAVSLVTLGGGTANSEMLDYFGLESSEKAVIFGIVTDEVWDYIKKGLQSKLQIDVPGTGIAFTKRELLFLTEGQKYEKGEESTLKETKHELLVVIANQGYSDLIMKAARSANANGGTIIHAKGIGMELAEKFLGVSLASEKEIIFLVTKKEEKNKVMKAVMQNAGMESKAKSIVFSLPVTDTAGLRLIEES